MVTTLQYNQGVTKESKSIYTDILWYTKMEPKRSITTIKLDKQTKARLDKLKIHKRETYDDILQEILKILNLCKFDPAQARHKLHEIDDMRKKLNKKEKK
jgi:hypothetical protein